jgi:cell division protein FtsL
MIGVATSGLGRAQSGRARRALSFESTGLKPELLALAAVLCLAIVVVASGVLVVGAEHEARQLFVELEELNRERDRLQVDWGRLQLEQSTWATHARIESLAREQLNLEEPADDELIVVTVPQP